MRNVLVSSFFGFILLYALNGYFDRKIPVAEVLPKTPAILNPIDTILGEKVLEDGTLRKDNFQSILKLKAGFLSDSSELYRVQELTKDLFLLTRKKFYQNNRSYSLFVKIKGDQIVCCQAVNDFPVRGAVYSDQRIYFIGDDYCEIISPWKPTYTVKITCVDLDFRNLWNISSITNKGYFFHSTGLELKNGQLIAGIGLQNEGSSTMCVDEFDVTLDKSGKITNSVYSGGYSCGGRNTGTDFSLNHLFSE